MDSKTFLFNGEAKPIGYKCVAEGDLITLDGGDLMTGSLFHHLDYKQIIVKEAGGSVIVDGSASGKTAKDIVQAINNIVNFNGGDGVGALLIAKKTDGKDAVFSTLDTLKTYYNANPKPAPDSAAIVGTTNTDGSVATITMPYVWNPSTNAWDSIVTNFKGDPGDGGTADLTALIKTYGNDGRVRFDENNKHFYFEVLQNGAWVQKAEIGASIIVDALRLIKGEKPTNIATDELAVYNKEITLPDGSKTIRPQIVFPDGSEFGLVVNDQATDDIVYRKNDGTLVHIPVSYTDEDAHIFTDVKSIKYTGGVALSKIADELRVDITGVHGGFIFVNVVNDLAINEDNITTYNTHTLSMREAGIVTQYVNLPLIANINGYFSIKVRNDRPSEIALVDIRAAYPDTIGDTFFARLNNGDTIQLTKPDTGTEWIVESLIRKADINNVMDGGTI